MRKLSPGQVAKKLGVTRQLVDRWLRAGRIKHIVLENGDRLIEPADAKKPPARKPGPKPTNNDQQRPTWKRTT